MDDKNALLNQLRIDRTTDVTEYDGSTRRWILIGVSIVLVAALAVGGWYFTRPKGVAVQAAVAKEVTSSSSGGGAAAGASMLDASGYIVARRQATVASKQIGRVVEVSIEEGQHVEKDQIIARLDDSNWRAQYEQAQAQLSQAEANLRASQVAFEDAKPIFKRNEQQMSAGVISAQTFDNARAAYNAAEQDLAVRTRGVALARAGVDVAKRNLDDTIVRAPFAGVVTVKAAQAGEIVSPQSAGGYTRTGIGTIVDMDSLEVEVDVSENFINRVRPSQPATVKLNAYPDWDIPAQVIAVIPTADRSKATVKVRVGFKERDPRILPDMGARVSFLSEPEKQDGKSAPVAVSAVLIPTDAVQTNGDTGTVYIINGNDTVERRVVRLGARTSDGQLVLSGLPGGTRIAASNLAALSDGAKIHVVTQEAGQGEGS